MDVSVIVPVYNAEKTLTACVESLLAQTVPAREIVLVDDGSTDGSGALCGGLAAKYETVIALHRQNGGAGSARNAGIEAARGGWLAFCDADDTLEPDFLEAARAAEQNGAALFIGGMAFDHYRADKTLARTELYCWPEPGLLSSADVARSLPALFGANCLSSACCKCYRADIFRDHALRFRADMSLYEDLEFVLRVLAKTELVYITNKALYRYRQDAAHLGRRLRDGGAALSCIDAAADAALALGGEGAAAVVGSLYSWLAGKVLLRRAAGRRQTRAFLDALAVSREMRGLPGVGRFDRLCREKRVTALRLWAAYRRARSALGRLKRRVWEVLK